MKTGRVLVLDGMWNKSLAAVRSFGKKGFFVAAGERNLLATALFSRYCSRRFTYPSPFQRPDDFLETLECELRRGSYDVVLPMETATQVLLTNPSVRRRLEEYVRIPFADASLTRRISDKAFLMGFAGDNGFDIPETHCPADEAEAARIAAALSYPAVIKPRLSSGSRGIVYVEKEEDFIESYRKVNSLYPFPIIQQFIPDGGGTFGVGVLMNSRSEVRASYSYRRLRSFPVSGGPSTLRESVRRRDLQETAAGLLKALKWTGIAHVEFKVDPGDNRARLLEVNPRFWGSLNLAIESGVDFPFLLWKMAMEGDIETVEEFKEGIRCRWLIPGDLLHFLNNPDRLRLKPHFFDFRTKDDIISASDPLPTLGRILSVLPFFFDKEMRQLIKR